MSTNLDRALAYLAKLPPAVSGSGGHDATLRAACECVRFGLSDDEAMAALAEFNQRCQPSWSEHELAHKIADARKLAGAQLRSGGANRPGRGVTRSFDYGALDRALAARRASRPATGPGGPTPTRTTSATAAHVLARPVSPLVYARETAEAMRDALEAVEQLPGYKHGLPVVSQAVEYEEYYWGIVWQSIGRPDPGLDVTNSPTEEHIA